MTEKPPDITLSEPGANAVARDDDGVILVRVVQSASVRFALLSIAGILILGAIYFAKALLLPIALALMLTLALSPVMRYFGRFGIPEFVPAMLVVVVFTGSMAAGVYYLAEPVQNWIAGAPQMGRQIKVKLRQFRAPVAAARNASKKLEKIVGTADPEVQKVAIQQSGILTDAANGAASVGATVGVTVVLLFFLLSSGRMFFEKLVRALPSLTEKKRAIRIAHTVEEEVSGYLFTFTLINLCLGLAIAGAMWTVGMPNPALWGVMAALLNFVPYLGAIVGLIIVSAVALISFDTIGATALTAGLYLTCTTIEGQFITPAVVGRRLELNTVAVFISVALWGWLWGIPGALIAVPLLVSVRVLCEHFESLATLGEFISAAAPEEEIDAREAK